MKIEVQPVFKEKILELKIKLESQDVINLLSLKLEGYIRNYRNNKAIQNAPQRTMISGIFPASTSYEIEILKSDEFILAVNTKFYEENVKIFCPLTMPTLNCVTKIEYFATINIITDKMDVKSFVYPFNVKVKNDFFVAKTYVLKNMVQIGDINYLDIIFDKLRSLKQEILLSDKKSCNINDKIRDQIGFLEAQKVRNFINDTIRASHDNFQNCIEMHLISEDPSDNSKTEDMISIFSREYNVNNKGQCIAKIKISNYINDFPIEITYISKIKYMKLQIMIEDSGAHAAVYNHEEYVEDVVFQSIPVDLDDGIFSIECELFSVRFTSIFTFDDFEVNIPILIRNK